MAVSPAGTVIRVSQGTFDPSRFGEVQAMNVRVAEYLAPAIGRLPGLIGYDTGVSPTGTIVAVSRWDSHEHADQLNTLKEMIVDARQEGVAAGVTYTPIVNYSVDWSV